MAGLAPSAALHNQGLGTGHGAKEKVSVLGFGEREEG